MSHGVTQARLVAAFREIGLESGDRLVVHSSLRGLGWIDGGPDAVLDALLEVIGPGGTLMLPTFNYTRPPLEGIFDPAETPCRTGRLPETARKRPNALRSLNPAHSFAAIGPEADALTRGHLETRAFGIGSPLDRLAARGGKVLLLGVGQVANSTIHVAEEHAGIPKGAWYDEQPRIPVRMPDGTLRTHQLDTSTSCSLAFGGAEGVLRRQKAIRDGMVNACFLQLMRGADVITHVAALLREAPDILRCTRAGCRCCAEGRRLAAIGVGAAR
jgi:aminoglycoside 3-N-acetyltransferase